MVGYEKVWGCGGRGGKSEKVERRKGKDEMSGKEDL